MRINEVEVNQWKTFSVDILTTKNFSMFLFANDFETIFLFACSRFDSD